MIVASIEMRPKKQIKKHTSKIKRELIRKGLLPGNPSKIDAKVNEILADDSLGIVEGMALIVQKTIEDDFKAFLNNPIKFDQDQRRQSRKAVVKRKFEKAQRRKRQ